MQGELPKGLALAPDERLISVERYRLSSLAPFLYITFVATTKRLAIARPRTLFAWFQVGEDRVSYPLTSIAGVHAATGISAPPLVIGVLLALAGLGAKPQLPLLAVIGFVIAALAFRSQVVITNSGGGRVGHLMSVYDRMAARQLAENLLSTVATYAGREQQRAEPAVQTSPAPPVTPVRPAGRSPAERLAELARLREAGLITADEYEAKRAEVVAQL